MHRLHRLVFAVFAAGMLLLGSLGLLLPFAPVPRLDDVRDPELLHVTQEAAAGLLALGLCAAGAALRPARSAPAHAALTVYFLLIAAVHWIDFARDLRPLTSGLVNSVPFVVLAGLWRVRRPPGAAGRP
jgi:hypothetical protein